MNYGAKKIAFVILAISLSAMLMSVIYTVYSIDSLPNTARTEYPTIIVDGSAPNNVVGVVIDKNLTIQMVESNSAAAQAGLEVGDVILEINGQSVKTIDDVKKEISDVVLVLPTDSPESAKLPQDVRDATTAAYIKANYAAKNLDKLVINVRKNEQKEVTVDIDKQPQGSTSDVTPTPVSSDDLYF